MAKYRIEHKIDECIGCAACTALSENWEMIDKDGEEKADFIKQEFDEEELETNLEAAESCPVEVISIVNIETGEKVNE